jgi:ATPase family associated with various cellular activities (AAA)
MLTYHPCIPEIAKRYADLDSQVRRGRISVSDAIARYACVVKDGTLGMPSYASAIATEADDTEFSVPFVVTTLQEDRDGDVVVPMGCQLDNFKHNPICYFGHQQYQHLPFPIAKCKSPDGRLTVFPEENRIRAVMYFDRNDSDAVKVYQKVRDGFLNATSIAFVPIAAERRDREAEKGIYENRAHTHSSPMTPVGWIFRSYDLTEISVVGVPANAGAIRDWLDTDKELSPRLQKSLTPYAAKSIGRSFSGWCPPGTVACPDGSCKVVAKAYNPLPGEPDDSSDEEDDDGEVPTWDAIVDDKAWRSVQAPTECAAKNIVKWEIDAQRRAEMPKNYTEEEFRDRFPSPKIAVKGPYKLGKRRVAPKAVAKEFEPEDLGSDEGDSAPRERWNKSLSNAFDQMPELQMGEPGKVDASTTHRVAAKYLGCQIKDLHQSSVMVPSPRMGSFLNGLKQVLSSYHTVEVRNLSDRSEQPLVYETIQLNSKLRDTFLVQGTMFMESVSPRGKRANPRQMLKVIGQVGKGSGPHNNYGAGASDKRFVIKFRPEWGGLNVTVITKRADAALNQDVVDRSWAWAREHNYLKGEAFALSGEFLPRTSEGFGDVFLEEHNKTAVQRTLELFNKKGIDFANRGVIMCGPPGTGKTLSSRILRNQAKGTFIWVSSRDFHASGSVGGISMAFEMAKELAPCVLCMEDVDNWLRPTSVDLLKTEMDGISRSKGVLTVLTTNFPEELPDALIDRPGRFHDVLEFKNPTANARKAMLAKWLPNAPAASIKEAVERSDGYSGAHVYELAHFAKSLQEHDDLAPAQAVAEALRKVEEQRQLVTALKRSGGGYERARHRSHHEAFPMKAKSFGQVAKGLGKVGCKCGGSCGECSVAKSQRFTDWKAAHTYAQNLANTTGQDVAIRAANEFGKKGFNVSIASKNDSDYARAEIVKPNQKSSKASLGGKVYNVTDIQGGRGRFNGCTDTSQMAAKLRSGERLEINTYGGGTQIEVRGNSNPSGAQWDSGSRGIIATAKIVEQAKSQKSSVDDFLERAGKRRGEALLPTRPVEDIFSRMHNYLGKDPRVPSLPEWDAWKQAVTEHYVNLRTAETRMAHRRALEQAYNALVSAAKRLGLSTNQSAWSVMPSDGTKSLGSAPAKSIRNHMAKRLPSEVGKPFAGYHDFAACVSANSGKDDPDAYCATIMRQVEGKGIFSSRKPKVGDKATITRPILGSSGHHTGDTGTVIDVDGDVVSIRFSDGSTVSAAGGEYKLKQLSEASGTAGGYTVPVSTATDVTTAPTVDACAECGGSGECVGCDGAGEVGGAPCETCGGSGECDRCDGAGTIQIEATEA